MSAVQYAVDGRVARITLNRPERGNGLTARSSLSWSAAWSEADLDPAVHVLLLSGNGKGFCGGYDLVQTAERRLAPLWESRRPPADSTAGLAA